MIKTALIVVFLLGQPHTLKTMKPEVFNSIEACEKARKNIVKYMKNNSGKKAANILGVNHICIPVKPFDKKEGSNVQPI